MGQSEEYLAAHKVILQKDEEIARLRAQVEELQGDVSRLTIENEQLKEQLASLGPIPFVEAIENVTHHPEIMDAMDKAMRESDTKPTKKPRPAK